MVRFRGSAPMWSTYSNDIIKVLIAQQFLMVLNKYNKYWRFNKTVFQRLYISIEIQRKSLPYTYVYMNNTLIYLVKGVFFKITCCNCLGILITRKKTTLNELAQ